MSPWVEYWRLAMRLEDTSDAEVRAFLASTPAATRRAAARATGCGCSASGATGRRSSARPALYTRDDLEIRCYALARAPASAATIARSTSEAIWLEPEGAARRLPRLRRGGDRARGASRPPRSGSACACCSRTARSPRRRTRSRYLPRAKRPTSACCRGRAPAQAPARPPAGDLEPPAREVVVLAGVRYRAQGPGGCGRGAEGALGEAAARPSCVPAGARVAYEARARTTSALELVRARRRRAARTRSSRGRRAPRCAPASGRRCARRSTACRRRRAAIRPGPTGTAARSPAQGEETGARAYFLRIAGQTELLRPARQRGARLRRRAARDGARADRAGSRRRRKPTRAWRARWS